MKMRETLLMIPVLLSPAFAEAPGLGSTGDDAPMVVESDGAGPGHLTADGSLADILDHPAFSGFAARILPWDDRGYDPEMPLAQLGRLLPYHSAVRTGTVIAGLNRMIDDANAGETIFFDIYPAGERATDPAKAKTGLFYFRGRPGAPFAVIAPGGGFAYVGSLHEGYPYAQQISAMGMNAFVLKYRAGQGSQAATEDLATAITWIVQNADALGVSTEGYSLWGSSAGARMVGFVGSHGPAAFGGGSLPRPAAVIMAYTSHGDVSAIEPPTFVVVGENDAIAPAAAMERRLAALRRLGTETEYHKFPGVGHGFGAGTGTPAEDWIADAVRFWQRHP